VQFSSMIKWGLLPTQIPPSQTGAPLHNHSPFLITLYFLGIAHSLHHPQSLLVHVFLLRQPWCLNVAGPAWKLWPPVIWRLESRNVIIQGRIQTLVYSNLAPLKIMILIFNAPCLSCQLVLVLKT
jgi:hypothetical protein